MSEDEPVGHVVSVSKSSRPWYRSRRGLFVAIIILAVAATGYILISKFAGTPKDNVKTDKVLTVDDLEDPDIELTSGTSDASVENLRKGLQAKIDKQIAAKENPIDTVKELAGVLSNTTNEKRQAQAANFIEDFLANHEDTLWFKSEDDMPDQAQVNYWKAELYAYLIHNFRSLMAGKFTGADGKPIDTTKEQLKYIDLYLALANDPVSHPPIAEEDRDIFVGYLYGEAGDFAELRSGLIETGAAQ